MTMGEDRFTDELSLAELAAQPDRVLGKDASASALHYCSPAHGGWGMIRVALLVPEVHLLFVCPAACGRHGAIAAIEQGCRDRITYLCIEDREIVLGTYEAEIERAVGIILGRLPARPRALLIFVSCIDDLLGTDHDAALARMEAAHGIPIRLARMNPISLGGSLPPGIRVQRSMYEFLEKAPERDRGILILGAYRPPPEDSELGRFFAFCGYGPLRHPEFCRSFDDFKALSRCAAALLVRPEGRAAGEDMVSRLDIPLCRSFMAFDREGILERYGEIARFLGRPADDAALEAWFRPGIEEVEAREEEARNLLGDASVAIDSTVTIAPFSLALALVRGGINVTRVYTDECPLFERGNLEKLTALRGDIIVANPSHPRKYGPPAARADVAAGFEAGYATAAPVTVPLVFDEQLYGFEGYARFLEALIRAVEKGQSSLREQIEEYGLVI
ncbi:MAG: nitrogenase component 1 [Treponema sp.]|nr:nitrogenase component 1 [Treponema sp.]